MLSPELAAGRVNISAHFPAHGHMDPALFQGRHESFNLFLSII
jgi:hypothetical protein